MQRQNNWFHIKEGKKTSTDREEKVGIFSILYKCIPAVLLLSCKSVRATKANQVNVKSFLSC